MAGTYQIDTIVLEASISLHMTAGREQALCTVQGEHVRAMVVLTQLNVDSSPGLYLGGVAGWLCGQSIISKTHF